MAALALVAAANAPSATTAALRDCPRGSSRDARARELARTAQRTIETYATDHNGSYARVSLQRLHRVEPSLTISRAQAEREHLGAYVYEAASFSHGNAYILRARTLRGDRFAITRTPEGELFRDASMRGGGCQW